MNVFGIGTMELLVIFLVAFIALGPGKTMEVARTIGKMAREARRAFTDIMDAASLSDSDVDSSRSRSGRDAGTGGPTQPPADPLPMPSHLDSAAEPAAKRQQQDKSDNSNPGR